MSDEDLEMADDKYGSRKMRIASSAAAAASSPLSRAGSTKFATLVGNRSISQKGVTFDVDVDVNGGATALYQCTSLAADEKLDLGAGSRCSSMKDLRGMLSRGPSYRESTIIDSTSGKETIKMISKQPSMDIPSVSSTRQNSGGK